jgi:hypothetical protein
VYLSPLPGAVIVHFCKILDIPPLMSASFEKVNFSDSGPRYVAGKTSSVLVSAPRPHPPPPPPPPRSAYAPQPAPAPPSYRVPAPAPLPPALRAPAPAPQSYGAPVPPPSYGVPVPRAPAASKNAYLPPAPVQPVQPAITYFPLPAPAPAASAAAAPAQRRPFEYNPALAKTVLLSAAPVPLRNECCESRCLYEKTTFCS